MTDCCNGPEHCDCIGCGSGDVCLICGRNCRCDACTCMAVGGALHLHAEQMPEEWLDD